METVLGIDLGTTNSEVSIIRDKEIVVVEKDGRKLLPSVVGIDPAGNLLVGHAARNQAVLYPERTVKSIKRLMGENTKVKLGDNEYSPPEISAMILKTLKTNAEEILLQKFSKAVITVPAFFNDTQREATRLAGELAGLDVVRIINEPTAASLCYETAPDENGESNSETILVYDLGGGTFDVSIVRAESGVIEVLASHGDTHLGGDDFDQLLFNHICDNFKKLSKFDLRENPVSVSRIMQATEAAKIELSTKPFVTIKEEFIAEKNGMPLHLEMEIDRHDYERMIFPLLDRTILCLNEALEDAALRPSDINKIIMVGGASRTPLVHSLIENRMGMTPHGEIDPDLCVTMGAAIQGGLIAGTEVGKVLVDITPHTLGIHAVSSENFYSFSPLIKRNTPIPCRRSNVYYKSHKEQKKAEVSILQGEHNDIRQNTLIGEFWLEGMTENSNSPEIICQFDLDINGILHVTAIEKGTGLTSETVVENVLTKRDHNANEKFKSQLKQFFHEDKESILSPDKKSDGVDDVDVKGGVGEVSVGGVSSDKVSSLLLALDRLSQVEFSTFADELKVVRKAVKLLGKDNVQTLANIGDAIELSDRVLSAIDKKDKETAKQLSSDLDDLLYYLDDSV
ncbi:MAG: Hsp70 family protein [Planctomycetaceae bacterium]|jgi:molecular chaperone DnaK|nr:Hsp70 family protein [Planctomycetaceae bacterium]